MKTPKRALTRRALIRGSIGTALSASLAGLGWPKGKARAARSSMVQIVRDEKVMDSTRKVDTAVLKQMLEQTLLGVTGRANTKEAWLSLISPDDVVGLVSTPHLNPTHDELVEVVTNSLVAAGISWGRIKLAQGGPDKPKGCTALIAMPALKAHWLTGIGTVIKNYIMYSGRPSRYHQADSAKLGGPLSPMR